LHGGVEAGGARGFLVDGAQIGQFGLGEAPLPEGLAERARAAANPLRDFLEEVELVEA